MLGWSPVWLQDAAVDLGILAGIVVSLGVLAKTTLGKSLIGLVKRTYRRAFGQPFRDWAKLTIQEAVRPEIDALRVENTEQHGETAERLVAIEQRVAVVETNTEIHATRLDNGSVRMDEIFSALGGIQEQVRSLRSTQLEDHHREAS